jgi:hypothetical protein
VKQYRLSLDLVPFSTWFSNVRSHVNKTTWEVIRAQVFSEAKYLCEICADPASSYELECHEVWEYDSKNNIQKLINLIALCNDCHTVKHYGLAQIQHKEQKALKHFMKINKVKKKEAESYIADAFMQWAERSGKTWKLDISYLTRYNIDVSKIKSPK